jgi:hypothetical protein
MNAWCPHLKRIRQQCGALSAYRVARQANLLNYSVVLREKYEEKKNVTSGSVYLQQGGERSTTNCSQANIANVQSLESYAAL